MSSPPEGHLAARIQADEFRLERDLGSEPIDDLWGLIQQESDLDIAFRDFGFKADGIYRWNGQHGLIVVNKAPTDFGRVRYTAAHELGHHVMHRSAGLTEIVDLDVYAGPNQIEVQANAFAAYLLAPEAAMKSAFPGRAPNEITVSEVIDLMLEYGISFRTAIYRLHNSDRIGNRDRDRLIDESRGQIRIALALRGKEHDLLPSTDLPTGYIARVFEWYRNGVIGLGRLSELLMVSEQEARHRAEHLEEIAASEADELAALGDLADDFREVFVG